MTIALMLLTVGLAVQDEGLQNTSVTAESLVADLQAVPAAENWVQGLVDRFVARGAAPEEVVVSDIPEPEESELQARRQALQRELQRLGMGPIDIETIVRQEERRMQQPAQNVAVRIPGQTERFLVVGAPYDPPEFGTGVIDNWSSAVMLAALFEAGRSAELQHGIHLVAFGAEEVGSRGSAAYVESVSEEEWELCDGVLLLDCLGTAPPAAWKGGSSSGWNTLANMAAQRLGIPFQLQEYVDHRSPGADAVAFRRRNVPTLYLNGLDLEEAGGLLHTKDEVFEAIRPDDYVDTFRLVIVTLRMADRVEGSLRITQVRESLPVEDEHLVVPLARYRLFGRDGPRLVDMVSVRTGSRAEPDASRDG